TETPSSAFDAFVAANAAAWQRLLKARGPGSGFIAVDLLHNNASVLILNILVARYLAELWSADIVGLLSPSFTGFAIPMGEVERLARSFGIGHFAVLDGTAPARPPWRDPAGWRLRRRVGRQAGRLAALSGTALRQAVLGLTADGGLPIGDFVYDSHLYARGIGTFESYDDRLAEEL